MIDCTEFRRALLADPRDPRAELRAHREACGSCAAYALKLQRFEARLERAARLPVAPRFADGASAGGVPGRRGPRARGSGRFADRRWYAMAASLLIGVVVVASLWLALPRDSLAEALVAHVMYHEPQAWRRTDVPVPDARLAAVLRNTHVRLSPGAGLVTYARSCPFRGHEVPHVVVQSERGPVTVMILVHEHVRSPTHFDEQGYRGVILPVPGHGALAVLTRGRHDGPAFIEQVAKRLLASIVWTG